MTSLTMDSNDILEVNDLSCKIYNVGYNRGYHECYKNLNNTTSTDTDYERGLKDAYECFRRIVFLDFRGGISCDELKNIFGDAGVTYILNNFSMSEIVSKVREWEKNTEDRRKPTIANVIRLLGEGKHAMAREMLETIQNECAQPCEKKPSPEEASFSPEETSFF